MTRFASLQALLRLALAGLALYSTAQGTAQEPGSPLALPPDIERLLDLDPLPPVVVDPTARYALLVHERQLLPIERLSEPAGELAGHTFSLLTGGAYAPLAYYGLTLIDLRSLETTPIALPADAVVGYPSWSPDGSRFAFTVTRSVGAALWVGEPASGLARSIAPSVDTARGLPCAWLPDNRRLLCRFSGVRDGGRQTLDSLFDRMAAQALPGEPTTLSERQTRLLLEAQLAIVDSQSAARWPIGSPKAFEAVVAAPAQAFLLVTRLVEPYPQVTGVHFTASVTEVWDRYGNVIARVPDRARAIEWQASSPATLTWIEEHDGVDRVMSLQAPFSGPPRERFALPHRFAGLRWLGDSSAALVSDYDSNRRRTELWYIDFADSTSLPRVVTGYGSGQLPLMRTNAWGFATVAVHDNGFYLSGTESTGAGPRAYLDRVALPGGLRSRIWQAGDDGRESVVDVLSPDARVLLVRRESPSASPNYFIGSAARDVALPVTHFEPPSPLLASARRIPLEYEREDGVELSASLYLPPGYDRRTRLPLLVWAYPRQVSVGETATISRTEESAMTFTRAFRLFFLLRGYAVLDDVSMPVVGNESDANDTFVKQIVANAAAAIEAAGSTGSVDTTRVGVAGHSYGAFMVANLLAHSRMFGAGVAMSGAYNRTLTPFGFQTERRTLWQAPNTYLAMSPLLFSDRIDAPLLLVHGLKDNNAGTSPQQSLQFYQAIRGNGGDAELLLLPWEGHSYRSRESVRKTAAQMLRWFDDHLKPAR
jgi:dipeptidyl aminopeptidase/acylaminoacyl peptidase